LRRAGLRSRHRYNVTAITASVGSNRQMAQVGGASSMAIVGLDALLRKLGTMGKVEDELTPWAERTLKAAKRETDYTQSSPPRVPGQTYIRTGKLMRGWQDQVSVRSGEIMARRYNVRTNYGPFVMGRSRQTGIFAGRWPTDASIEQKIAPAAIDDLQRTIQGIIDR
jgi:hypothetical protein